MTDAVAAAVLSVFRNGDLLRLLAHNYLDNLRDVLHLARVSQRTYQVLYKCRELEEARNDYRTFCVSRHIVSDTCKICVGYTAGQFCYNCQTRCDNCAHCSPPELFAGGLENWVLINKYPISSAQCHALQRASNALYNVGSPRLALHYWTAADIPDNVKPDCRVNHLAQNGCIHAIQWLARNKPGPFRLFAYGAREMVYSAISRSSRYTEEDQRDRRAVLLACLSYCRDSQDVEQQIKEAMRCAMDRWTCDKKMFRLVLEFAPALLSDPSIVAELIARTMPMILGGGSGQIRRRRVKDTCYLIQHARVPNREAVFASALEGLQVRLSRHTGSVAALRAIGLLMEIFAQVDNDNKKAAAAAATPFDWTRVFETPEFYQLNIDIVAANHFDRDDSEEAAVCEEFLEWLEAPRCQPPRELPLLVASVKQCVTLDNQSTRTTDHHFVSFVLYMSYIAGAFLTRERDVEPDQKRLKK